MNNLSARERRLALVFGAVVLLFAVYFLFLRGGDEVAVPDVFPDNPPAVVTPAIVQPEASPTFVIPPSARDPFRAS